MGAVQHFQAHLSMRPIVSEISRHPRESAFPETRRKCWLVGLAPLVAVAQGTVCCVAPACPSSLSPFQAPCALASHHPELLAKPGPLPSPHPTSLRICFYPDRKAASFLPPAPGACCMLTKPVKLVLLFFTFSVKPSCSLVFTSCLQLEMPAFPSNLYLFL